MTHRWLLVPGALATALYVVAGCSTPCEETLTCDVSGEGGAGASGPSTGTGAGDAGGGGEGMLLLGEACTTPGQCESGFCVDDVCCESACDDLCETCGDTPGTCTAHAAGTDPDDDCGAATCVAPGDCGFGQIAWSKQFGVAPGGGGQADDSANAVVADALGRVYAIGDFDAGNAFDQNSVDVRRFSDTGSPDYAVAYVAQPNGGPPFLDVTTAHVTGAGELLVAGYFTGTVDWGQGPLTASGAAYVTLLNSSGQGQWTSATSGSGGARVYGAGLANDGTSMYFAGGYNQGVTYGSTTLTSTSEWRPFLARVTSTGGADFATGFSSNEPANISDVAIGDNDTVYVAGSSGGGVNLGGSSLASGSFIAKLDANANHVWSKAFNNTSGSGLGFDDGTELVRSEGGALYFSARFSEPINLGAGELSSGASGVANTFVARFDDEGDLVWATLISSASELSSARMAVDSVGDIVFAVTATGSVTIDEVTVTPSLTKEVVVGKLRPDGTLRWARPLGATEVADVAVDPAGNILLIGTFEVPITLGNDSYTPLGDRDVFLVKLSP